MSDRKPNEILVNPDVLQQFLSEGGARVFSVKNGPAPEAEIIGVEWRYVNGAPLIVLVYSSDVPEPVLTHEHGLETLRDEVRRLPLWQVRTTTGEELTVLVKEALLANVDYPHVAALLRSDGAHHEE